LETPRVARCLGEGGLAVEIRWPVSGVVSAHPRQILREGVGFCGRGLGPLRMTGECGCWLARWCAI
jgi:hypothetical protein